jgi:peptidoglycan/LPS O-acetylase OafA/YrhL
MPTNASQGRIQELDGIRGVAILLVMAMHYFYFYPAANHHPQGLLRNLYVIFEKGIAIGWSGVDLFFVLSGFLIGGILLDVRSSRSYFRTFYLRRFFRIIPVYYAWITLYILLILLIEHFGAYSDAIVEPRTWFEIGAQFLFLQNLGFIHYSGLGLVLPVTWSLAVEEQFYLVAPVMVRLLSSCVLVSVLIAVLVLAPPLRILTYYWPPPWVVTSPGYISPSYSLMPCRADSLAMGMLVALLWRKLHVRAWLEEHCSVLYVMFAIFLAGVVVLDLYWPLHDSMVYLAVGLSWLAFFYALVIILALVNPSGPIASLVRMKWLREFGRISYCLYLIHPAVNVLCHRILFSVSGANADWRVMAVPLVAIVVSYSVAKLSWICLESPMLRRGHGFRYQ